MQASELGNHFYILSRPASVLSDWVMVITKHVFCHLSYQL